nr:MAG TPA: hypothetical protein [Bacteriophage sp.]
MRHGVSRGVVDSNGYVIDSSIAIIKVLWQMLVLVWTPIALTQS